VFLIGDDDQPTVDKKLPDTLEAGVAFIGLQGFSSCM